MLEQIDEYEFIQRVHIPRSIQTPAGLNFPCVFCHEGKSAGKKKRAFILTNSKKYNYNTYFCQNCGKNIPFKSFLEYWDQSLYEEYRNKEKTIYLEKIKKSFQPIKKIENKKSVEDFKLKYFELKTSDGFIPANFHTKATQYCIRRKVPLDIFKGFYYNPSIKVKSGDKYFEYKNMLVMPFYHGDKIYGYQARSLKGKTFYTHSQEGQKIYNLYNVDSQKRVYIVEGIFDSFYLDNCIAMVAASISKHHLEMLKDPVFVYDNDCMVDTYNRMEKMIDKGYSVVFWPMDTSFKDINEAICSGLSKEEIKQIIDKNTHEGIQAKIRLKIYNSRKKRR